MVILLKNEQVKVILVFLLLVVSSNGYAQSKYYPVNLSAFYPASLNNEQDTVGVNLNLFYSKVTKIDYFNLGLGATLVSGSMSGLQLNFGFTYIGSVFKGISFTFGANVHNGDVFGLELALLTNLVLADVKGMQFSIASNFITGNLSGFQISPLFNIVGGHSKFLQVGNANIVGKHFKGFQLGLVFNFVGFTAYGTQISISNFAGKFHGAQIGLGNITYQGNGVQLGIFNKAVNMRGVQLGVINFTKKQNGVPIGLINYSDDSKFHLIVYTSNFTLFNLGIKLTSNNFYSIIDGGKNLQESNSQNSYILGFHYGYDFELTNLITVSPDIGYVQIFDNNKPIFKNNEFLHQFALQPRISISYRAFNFFRIFVGVGFSRNYILYRQNHLSSNKTIIFGGISIL